MTLGSPTPSGRSSWRRRRDGGAVCGGAPMPADRAAVTLARCSPVDDGRSAVSRGRCTGGHDRALRGQDQGWGARVVPAEQRLGEAVPGLGEAPARAASAVYVVAPDRSAKLGTKHQFTIEVRKPKQQFQTPKLLLADSGMAAALVGVDAARCAATDPGGLAGMLLETFVAMELVKAGHVERSRRGVVLLPRHREARGRCRDRVGSGRRRGDRDESGSEPVTSSDIRGLELVRTKLGARFKVYRPAGVPPVCWRDSSLRVESSRRGR